MKTLTTQNASRAPSTGTDALLSLGQRLGWDVALLGYAPVPTEAVQAGNWLVVPAHLDHSPLPERTRERLTTLFERGLRPVAFVVVHEAPKRLPAATPRTEEVQISLEPPARRALRQAIGRYLTLALGAGVLAVAGAALLALLVAIGTVAVAGLVFFGLLSAASIDPILVAVMDDGAWVEIDRWWT